MLTSGAPESTTPNCRVHGSYLTGESWKRQMHSQGPIGPGCPSAESSRSHLKGCGHCRIHRFAILLCLPGPTESFAESRVPSSNLFSISRWWQRSRNTGWVLGDGPGSSVPVQPAWGQPSVQTSLWLPVPGAVSHRGLVPGASEEARRTAPSLC